jgi:hypothetical protein
MKKFANISLVNPVAPMAMENDFKTHEKTSYPFSPEPKRPKCVKVMLNSIDRQAGSSLTRAVFNVRLPTEFQNKQLNMVVDSFVVSSSPNSVSNLGLFPYFLRIVEYRNPFSYSSTSQTTSGRILLTTGTSYFNNTPREKGGNTVVDTTLFSRPLTFEIFSPHFDTAAANGVVNEWSVELSLWDDVA